MKNNPFRKTQVIVIIFSLICVVFAPLISGGIFKNDIIRTDLTTSSSAELSLSFYTFDKSGSNEKNVSLPRRVVENITLIFEELQYLFKTEPFSDETQKKLIEFIDLIDIHSLIPDNLSKDDVIKMVNPSWARCLKKILGFTDKSPFLRGRKLNKLNDFVNVEPVVSEMSSDISLLCNIASVGTGIPLPFFMLPRPRGLMMWAASNAATYVGSLLQAKNYVAQGNQQGIALGFVGFGLSAFFGWFVYGLIGYAAVLLINAAEFEDFGPPNNPPIISEEIPLNGKWGIPISQSELSFRISDADGDRMSYTVTTNPDIGSGSGFNKRDGVYKVQISNLELNQLYTWTVEVSDGEDTTVNVFEFYTGEPEIIFFDDFDDNEKDFDVWTEINSNGVWEEVNQRTEFTLQGVGNPIREAIESIYFPVEITEEKSAIISFDIISDISSNIGVGQFRFYVWDNNGNYVMTSYYRPENKLQYIDKNKEDWVPFGSRDDGTWNNNIEIYSNRYRIKMSGFDSGWVDSQLFSSSNSIKVGLVNKLEWPSGSWTGGYDNVFIYTK